MSKKTAAKTAANLFQASWRVVRSDKAIIRLQIAIVAIGIASIVVSFLALGGYFMGGDLDWKYFVILAVLLVVYKVVTTFFEGAVAYSAFERFDGRTTTVTKALRQAYERRTALVKFGLLGALVGYVLEVVGAVYEDLATRIAVLLVGVGWETANVFSLPHIVRKNETNPIVAAKESSAILVKQWKENIYAGVGATIVVGVSVMLVLAFTALSAVGFFTSNELLQYGGAIGGVIVVFVSAVLIGALNTILKTALYYHADTGEAPAGFDNELLRKAFKPKKKWLA